MSVENPYGHMIVPPLTSAVGLAGESEIRQFLKLTKKSQNGWCPLKR